jgi:hypothetical protein
VNQEGHLPLIPFEPAAAEKLSCAVTVRRDGGLLLLDYAITGPLDAISIPPEHDRPGFMPKLWLHTCFECFVRREGSPSYTEWNFSLDCNWWMCRFDDYRSPSADQPPDSAPRDFQIILRESGICLKASVACADGAGLLVGPAVILEHPGGGTTHWALWHPADRPDFHQERTCRPLRG